MLISIVVALFIVSQISLSINEITYYFFDREYYQIDSDKGINWWIAALISAGGFFILFNLGHWLFVF